MGQPVMVKMSEAEKNLAWEAAEQAKRMQRELGVAGVAAAAGLAPGAAPDAAAAQAALAAELAMPQGPGRLVLSNLPTTVTGAREGLAMRAGVDACGLGGGGRGERTPALPPSRSPALRRCPPRIPALHLAASCR